VAWEDGDVNERPIRDAAAAICVGEAGSGEPEVLVVERSAQSRFLPGYVVFPGGAVEPEDGERASRWFGDATQAPRVAAIRELVEEAGLGVTAGGLIAASDLEWIDRDPPHLDVAQQICRWIAPPDTPVRFDARYFTIRADRPTDPIVDGREVARAWWTSPRALLSEWTEGEHKLYWPTWFTVGQLAACASSSEILGLRFEPREPTEHEETTMPRHVMEQDP
jgi:8-oxo-dGTP pyrophosphatase MutT (NUDIX family)